MESWLWQSDCVVVYCALKKGAGHQLWETLSEREAAIEELEDALAAAHTSVWRRLPAWLSRRRDTES